MSTASPHQDSDKPNALPTQSNADLRKRPSTPSERAELESSGWIITTSEVQSGDKGVEQSLKRSFKYRNFEAAWGFMSRVALQAEKLNVRLVVFLVPA